MFEDGYPLRWIITTMPTTKGDFIPCTRNIEIGDGVVYRPVRSWHSGTFAGEALSQVDGDGSGCIEIIGTGARSRRVCSPPKSVVHRLYWHTDRPERWLSAFLSYPNGLGVLQQYFWEVYGGGISDEDDVVRFTGDDAEAEMEAAIRVALNKPEAPKTERPTGPRVRPPRTRQSALAEELADDKPAKDKAN